MMDWKGYDTPNKKPMNYIYTPGNLQMRWFDLCKLHGTNPHKRMELIIKKDIGELGDDTLALSEIETQIGELQERRKQLKAQKPGLSKIISKNLVIDLDDQVRHIQYNRDQNTVYIPPPKWLYYIISNLSNRYETPFNGVLKIFEERCTTLIIDDEDFKNDTLRQIAVVKKNGNNGMLSSMDVSKAFEEASA